MRPVRRATLPASVAAQLSRLQTRVNAAADPKAEADTRWDNKPAKPFGVVRDALLGMANGRARCMYCEDSAGTDIEHFWPKSAYPARAFDWANYLLACSYCNSNLKRTQFPCDATGAPLLIDPSDPMDAPSDHLLLIPSSGNYADQSPKGKATIEVFDLNCAQRPERLPSARRAALLKLQLLIQFYDRCIASGDAEGADVAKAAILGEPFPAVRDHLLRTAASPDGGPTLRRGVPEAIVRHGIAAW
jgi:uncharacterized protein (TIGR02646 family)